MFQGLETYWKDPTTGSAYTNHIGSFQFHDGNTWSVLQIPAITTFLKDYLNCPSATQGQIPGLPLFADEGHVVTKIFPLESIVSGYSFSDKRFSELALRLIAATGFWYVTYNRVEPFSFGKNAGCNFINPPTSPNTYEGFCTSSSSVRKCTFHRNHWGPCKSVANLYTEKVVYASENNWNWCWDGHTPGNNYESFEVGSKCFEGSRSTPYCLQYSCVWLTDVDRYQIRLKSPNGTELARCNSEGEQKILSGTSETVHCPDPDTFCSGVGLKYCPMRCSGHGTCNTSTYTCSCDAGWRGIDCSQRDWYTFWGR